MSLRPPAERWNRVDSGLKSSTVCRIWGGFEEWFPKENGFLSEHMHVIMPMYYVWPQHQVYMDLVHNMCSSVAGVRERTLRRWEKRTVADRSCWNRRCWNGVGGSHNSLTRCLQEMAVGAVGQNPVTLVDHR